MELSRARTWPALGRIDHDRTVIFAFHCAVHAFPISPSARAAEVMARPAEQHSRLFPPLTHPSGGHLDSAVTTLPASLLEMRTRLWVEEILCS